MDGPDASSADRHCESLTPDPSTAMANTLKFRTTSRHFSHGNLGDLEHSTGEKKAIAQHDYVPLDGEAELVESCTKHGVDILHDPGLNKV